MKKLITIAVILLASIIVKAQNYTKKDSIHAANESLKYSGSGMIILISKAQQADLDALTKVAIELSAPDYAKKQLQLVDAQYQLIITTIVKGSVDPAEIAEDGIKLEDGKIIVTLKPKPTPP